MTQLRLPELPDAVEKYGHCRRVTSSVAVANKTESIHFYGQVADITQSQSVSIRSYNSLPNVGTSRTLTKHVPSCFQQVGDNQSTKTSRLVDVVLTSTLESAFTTFCFVLSRDYGWISRDMDTDARIEKGDIMVDEDVLREAGVLVHRLVVYIQVWNVIGCHTRTHTTHTRTSTNMCTCIANWSRA